MNTSPRTRAKGAAFKGLLAGGVCFAALLSLAVVGSTVAVSGAHAQAAPAAAVNPIWPEIGPVGISDPETEKRIDAIMAQMTLEEKVGQMVQADIASIKPEDLLTYPLGSILAGGNSSPGGNEHASAQEWLKLSDDFWRANDKRKTNVRIPLLFGIDAVHGHSNLVGAIIFPHNVGLGATRDPELMREIAEITAIEMSLAGVDWTFAPTVAVSRDKRWGRAYESYSENPSDVAAYAGKVVEGLQGVGGGMNGIKAPYIISNAKHYLGDGGTLGGKDQGDAVISEADLALIHNAGYPTSIRAGVLTVMVSFSSWNGQKLTGSKYLITDVLKGRMGFEGFVVTDWNAQGQVPGCTNESCAIAINAGIDMFMAPDSWKAIYNNTVAQVKSGEIPMSRIDDAVRRILRVKIKAGLFDVAAPMDRPHAGKWDQLAKPEHREVARRAVRKSLVLIKNQDQILPLRPNARILVAGDGADNIGKQSGGWTLTWQGTGNKNSDFPNGQSIYGGIAETVKAEGGHAELSVDGSYKQKPDVAIVVIGEEPYAEFQGDRNNLDYQSGNRRDLALIKKLKAEGIPVVTVFLSGRPMFVNPEINASDAFVAAWLPGSEGGGVADVLIGDKDKKPRNDFHGKLSFSWPKTAVQQPLNIGMPGYDPQFSYGYGLTYADNGNMAALPEESGVSEADMVSADRYFVEGRVVQPWNFVAMEEGAAPTLSNSPALSSPGGVVTQSVVDAGRQEAGRGLVFNGKSRGSIAFFGTPANLSREHTGQMAIAITYRVDSPATGTVRLGMGQDQNIMRSVDVTSAFKGQVGEWKTLKVTLDCFARQGIDMSTVALPFTLESTGALSISYTDIRISSNEGDAICPAS